MLELQHPRDGGQELFVLSGDDALWHIWQVAPNVGWSSWESVGKPRDREFPEPRDRDLSEPLVQENPDGHLEVFAPGKRRILQSMAGGAERQRLAKTGLEREASADA